MTHSTEGGNDLAGGSEVAGDPLVRQENGTASARRELLKKEDGETLIHAHEDDLLEDPEHVREPLHGDFQGVIFDLGDARTDRREGTSVDAVAIARKLGIEIDIEGDALQDAGGGEHTDLPGGEAVERDLLALRGEHIEAESAASDNVEPRATGIVVDRLLPFEVLLDGVFGEQTAIVLGELFPIPTGGSAWARHFRKLRRFPLGAIRAQGFLKEQMLRGKDGMAGNLYKLEPAMILDPYLRRTRVPAWKEEKQVGWGGEISGMHWSGFVQYAFTLGDGEMIRVATEWVEGVLRMARPDGYLGAYFMDGDKIYEDYNAEGTAHAMRALISFYEATGREEVLEAVHRCMLWFCEVWAGDRKTCYAGQLIIEAMILCYRYTGDERLVSFANDYAEFLCRHNIFRESYESLLDPVHYYNSNHTAGMMLNLRHPALVYSATGEEKLLRASETGIRKIREKSAHVGGAPVSVNEYMAPVSSTGEIEYCSFTFATLTYAYMNEITGEGKYGDYIEELFYNGVQGARKKDEKAITYLSAPNQVLATDTSANSTDGDMQVYAPCYPVSCCPVNSVGVIPEFIRGMLLTDGEGNLYVSAYGPISLRHGSTEVTVTTEYPFRRSVALDVTMERGKILYLKVPTWAVGFAVTLDGEAYDAKADEKGYVAVTGDFSGGRRVAISFEFKVEIIHVDDRDAANKRPLAFRYGALVFSYHVPEKWRIAKSRSFTPLPEGWHWYNVYPDYEQPNTGDHYEDVGRRRDAFSWNVAVDEAMTEEDVTVEELDAEGYVWEHPRICLHIPAYKAPFLYSSYPRKTYEPFEERRYVTYGVPMTLVPYGCTNLRITYFPRADMEHREG